MEEIYKKRRSRTLIIILVVVACLVIIANLADDQATAVAPDTASKAKADSIEHAKATEAAANNKYQWRYSQETDPMTSGVKYYAQIYSTTWLSFQFPYNGGSEVDLFIRNIDNQNELILRVSKGQFLSSFGLSSSVRIRFDQDQPISVSYNSASDGSTDVIFLDDPDQLIQRIKKARNFIIEVAFYQEGNKHLEFAYQDFKWEH
jgi:hypothetical protein